MLSKRVIYAGRELILACDGNCDKAFGIFLRPRIRVGSGPDDVVFLADDEVGTAPVDPRTREGGEGKPASPEGRLNKWCARQCERSVLVPPGEPVVLKDWSKRVPNKGSVK